MADNYAYNAPDWLSQLPKYDPNAARQAAAPPPPGSDSNWLSAGLATGWHEALGAVGSAGQAVGTLAGWDGLSDAGKSFAASQAAAAKASGRPDLDPGGSQGPWSLPGMGYQVAKAVPGLVGAIGGGMVASAALPEAALGGAGAVIGSTLPRWLIGRGALTAAEAAAPGAAELAATRAGTKFAEHVAGATAAGLPLTVGGNVQAYEAAHGGKLDRTGAAEALAMGLPEAAVGGIAPAAMRDSATAAGTGISGLAMRMLKGGAIGAGIQAPQMAAQSVMTDMMDPNKSMSERAHDAVEAALGGALVGGALGAGMKTFARAKPEDIVKAPLDQLKAATDALDPNAAPPAAPAAPTEPLAITDQSKESAPAADLPPTIQPDGTESPHGPYALLPEDQLRTQHDELLAADNRTPEQEARFAMLGEELNRRTQPGRPAGEGNLYTPEQMGDRLPAAEAYAKEIGLPDDSPLRDGWNVTNRPELINHIKQALADAKPEDEAALEKIAKENGVLDQDGKPVSVPDQITALEGQRAQLLEQPGSAKRTLALREATAELTRLRPLVADHEEAAKLDEAAKTPPPEETAAADATAEPGLGETPPANDNRPAPPEALANKPAAVEHWNNMADMIEAMKDVNPDVAEQAQTALTRMEESGGTKGIAGKFGARQLMADYGAVVDEHRAARDAAATTPAPDAAPGTVSTDVPPELASQLGDATAADHPFIKDGSAPEWMQPSGNDNVPGAPRPAEPVVAPPRPQMADVAQVVSDKQMALRNEAQQIASDPNHPDAKAAQAALDKEASGKKQDSDAVAKFIAKREATLEKQMPEGPFTGLGPDSPNVVGTASVPHEHVALVDDMMNASQMGNVRVMIGDSSDVVGARGDAHGLNGSYASARTAADFFERNPTANGFVQQFGPNMKDFMIFIRPGMSDAQTLTAYGHEVGHIAEKVLFNNASKTMKASINKAFQGYLKQIYPDMPAQDLIRLARNKAQADEAARNIDPNMKAYELPNLEYYGRFGEWFADNVSRWFTAGEENSKPRTAVERFFANVAQKWKDVVSSITGNEYTPDATVKRFMDGASVDTARMWSGDGDGTPQFSLSEPRGPQDVNSMHDVMKTRLNGVSDFANTWSTNLGLPTLMEAIRRGPAGLQWVGSLTPAKIYQAVAPALMDMHLLTAERGTHHTAMNQAGATAVRTLARRPAVEQPFISRLMDFAARGGDFTKPYAEQDAAINNKGNQDAWRRDTIQANNDWNTLNKNYKDAVTAMQGVRDSLDAARLSDALTPIQRTFDMYAKMGDPIEGAKDWLGAIRDNNEIKEDPAKYRAYMQAAFDDANNAIIRHIEKHTENAAKLDAAAPQPEGSTVPAAGDALRESLDPLRAVLGANEKVSQQLGKMYVPQGRHGDYFVSGKLMTDDAGNPTPQAVQAFNDYLNANGFKNVSITPTADSGKFMIRVENASLMTKLTNAVNAAKDGGFIDPAHEITNGRPEELKALMRMMPAQTQAWVNKMAETIAVPKDATPEQRAGYQQAIDDIRMDATRHWMDTQRDSLNSSLMESQGRSGYSTDFYRSISERIDRSARAAATGLTAGRMSQAMQDLRAQVQASKVNATDPQMPLKLQAAADEAMLREQQKAWSVPRRGFDTITRLQHAFVIGMSPAYVLTLLGQMATLSWPELAKTHGYMGAAAALGRAAVPAFNILRSSFNGAHFEITTDGLKKAGIPADMADMILRSDNRGDLTQSTFTHQMMGYAKGADPRTERLRDWSTAMGRAAELLPRITTAIAAHDLNTTKPVQGISHDNFISKMVNGSQFEWGEGTSPRAVGQMGFFGPASRVMLAFTGYQSRMIQKYYEEMHALFTGKGTAVDQNNSVRGEAARFLAGHIAATVVLAGSMGLPGAGWAAAAADGLGNTLTGRDDFDVKAAYRTFLSDTFGTGVGEVLAKGLPRAANIDMSHEGEDQLLPFTRFLEDKHKFEEALGSELQSMAGSGTGMLTNAVLGARDMANGDYLQGAQKFLPGSMLKGMMQAFRLNQLGQYEDKNGVPIPLKPSATEILMTGMGLKPASKAEYDAERETMSGLEAKRTFREQNIASHIEKAIQHGDTEGLEYWLDQSEIAGEQHPGLPLPIMSVGRNALKYGLQGAKAEATETLVGQNPKDINLGEQTRYGNWRGRGLQ